MASERLASTRPASGTRVGVVAVVDVVVESRTHLRFPLNQCTGSRSTRGCEVLAHTRTGEAITSQLTLGLRVRLIDSRSADQQQIDGTHL